MKCRYRSPQKAAFKVLICLLGVLVFLTGSSFDAFALDASSEPMVTINFYHDNPCDSCDEREVLKEILARLAEKDPSLPLWQINETNAFTLNGKKLFEQAANRLGLTSDDLSLPCVMIGDSWASGYDEIEESLSQMLYQALSEENTAVSSDIPSVSSKQDLSGLISEAVLPEDSCVFYFFTPSCHDCQQIQEMLEELPESILINGQLSQVKIIKRNILEEENAALIQSFFEKYNVPNEEQRVPIIFLRDTYFSGYEAIESSLSDALAQGGGLRFEVSSSGSSEKSFGWKDLGNLFVTGFINGFNPCSISMLLLLLSLLTVSKKRVLSIGISFLLGKAVAYLILGLLAFFLANFLEFGFLSRISIIVNGILLIGAVLLAALNFLDYWYSKKQQYGKIRLQLPKALRAFNQNTIQKWIKTEHRYFPAAVFLLGIIISSGEFFCTGQIYIATILLLARQGFSQTIQALPAFLIYVFAMLLPALAVVFAISSGRNAFSVSELARQKLPLIKLINGLLFLVFAFILANMIFW